MMKSTPQKKAEKLKDRQAYRQALIQRREDLDRKLATVEEQIAELRS